MSHRANRAADKSGLTGVLGRLLATAASIVRKIGLAIVTAIVPAAVSARARYERSHRPLAGPRPGARLG